MTENTTQVICSEGLTYQSVLDGARIPEIFWELRRMELSLTDSLISQSDDLKVSGHKLNIASCISLRAA